MSQILAMVFVIGLALISCFAADDPYKSVTSEYSVVRQAPSYLPELVTKRSHAVREADIIATAMKEFDAIYNAIELDVKIITRKCGRYDAAPKRQIVIRRDNKFVGGKVLGYANAYHFLNSFEEN